MSRRLTLGLAALRAVGLGALLLLFVNPAMGRLGEPGHEPPLVLLDASLSMAGSGGQWHAALDSARAVGRGAGGVIWRFGDLVTAFDTTAPVAGVSRVGPALSAAAARGGPVVIVTDGVITDIGDVPADLRRRARVILLARPSFRDAFVAALDAPQRVSPGDTVRIKVAYGAAGPRPLRAGQTRGRIVVEEGGQRLASVPAVMPDSGLVATEVFLPASRISSPGFHVLTVRLDGVPDPEPRDDARQLVLEVSAQPSAVVLAAPPDWEARFLAKVLEDVARVPVRLYDQTEVGRWRDGRSLASAPLSAVTHDVQAARLVAFVGAPERLVTFKQHPGAAALLWNTAVGSEAGGGDWYVTPPTASPLEGDLAGISWDSLPPVSLEGGRGVGAGPRASDSGAIVVLAARLGRRGPAVPFVSLEAGGGGRRVVVRATGLWRWAFRGGAPEQAYRGLVAAMANWLLEQGGAAGTVDRVVPLQRVVANGLPLEWRWTDRQTPPPARAGVPLTLTTGRGVLRVDTLRFDAGGQAELRLPPGTYRYDIAGGRGRGVVVVELYSDEWRPSPLTLAPQSGFSGRESSTRGWRERWWLFVVALAAFTGEWVWRRRQGLP